MSLDSTKNIPHTIRKCEDGVSRFWINTFEEKTFRRNSTKIEHVASTESRGAYGREVVRSNGPASGSGSSTFLFLDIPGWYFSRVSGGRTLSGACWIFQRSIVGSTSRPLLVGLHYDTKLPRWEWNSKLWRACSWLYRSRCLQVNCTNYSFEKGSWKFSPGSTQKTPLQRSQISKFQLKIVKIVFWNFEFLD